MKGKSKMNVTIVVLILIIFFALEYHITSVHEGKKQHNCNRCSANFEKQIDFENHIASVYEGKKADIEDQIRKSRKVNNARKSLDFSLEESSESSHEHTVNFFGLPNCDFLATFSSKSCNENFCKFCIIKHYKNKDFQKDLDKIPL